MRPRLVQTQEPSFDLDAAVAGDRAARAALLHAYGPLVYGLCRRLDPQPDDAYQEIWEKVFRGLARFDTSAAAPVRSWIAAVAHRHLVDRSRRRQVRGVVVELGELPDDPKIDDRVADAQLTARLEGALARLPEPQRRVVVAHHLLDRPLEAIAADEDVAIGTLKSRLHRARARLLRLLGGAA